MPLKIIKIAALQKTALIFATFVMVACGQPLESETWDTQGDIESQEHALDIDKKTKEHGCFHRDTIPMTRAQALEAGLPTIMDLEADPGEERGGIAEIETEEDVLEFGRTRSAYEMRKEIEQAAGSFETQDNSSHSHGSAEEIRGWSDFFRDSDGDGWHDNPINQRRKLVLTKIKAYDEQEDSGDDEFYLFVNDVRYPNGSMSGVWNMNHGTVKHFNTVIAERTQGTNIGDALQLVKIKGRERDGVNPNNWENDDTLFSFSIDLMDYDDGDTFSIRKSYDGALLNWDYKIWFRVEVEYFADPNPHNKRGDSDNDGIGEKGEFAVTRDFGGATDPEKEDILVEVDWMSGHYLKTNAKRKVKTIYARRGYNLRIYRDQQVGVDNKLRRSEAQDLYRAHFSYADYNAFRYAVMTKELWGDNRSGWYVADAFFVDDSTSWIDGEPHAQAATFAHELGHAVGLDDKVFWMIDNDEVQEHAEELLDFGADLSDVAATAESLVHFAYYESSMNYIYQAFRVDYSDEVSHSEYDHNDWEDVDPSYNIGAGGPKFAK